MEDPSLESYKKDLDQELLSLEEEFSRFRREGIQVPELDFFDFEGGSTGELEEAERRPYPDEDEDEEEGEDIDEATWNKEPTRSTNSEATGTPSLKRKLYGADLDDIYNELDLGRRRKKVLNNFITSE
jgi:hypothetical protein